MIEVLLLGAGGTQVLPMAESLARGGCRVHGLFGGRLTYGYHSKFIGRKTLLPRGCGRAGYADFLADYLKRNRIDVMIPMSDAGAEVLSFYKEELSRYSHFIIPDYPVFTAGYDKGSLMRLCAENDLPHPRTVCAQGWEIDDPSLYPALIKPDITTGGRGMRIVRSPDEFRSLHPSIQSSYGGCHLQEYIPPGGRQLKVQLFADPHSGSEYSSVIHKVRFFPARGGSSCCNITIRDGRAVDLCRRALGLLDWEGFADFDLIEDPRDGEVKILELNPRIPACIRSAIESGMDYGRIITDASLGRRQAEYLYTPGKSLRHIGLDSMRRLCPGAAAMPQLPRRERFCQDFSKSDPLPFFFGTAGNILKIMGFYKKTTA